jgi:CRISPR-associated exonuclease Cas4
MNSQSASFGSLDLSGLFGLIAVLTFALAAVVVISLSGSLYLRRRAGMPRKEVVYDDVTDEKDGAVSETLFSRRYGLSGKPDYLLEDEEGLIPVEVKSGTAPRNRQPHRSHLMQLAVYFVLVEDALHSPVPYGLIRYKDRTLRVENTDELREELFSVITEMTVTLARNTARRSHNQANRCARCSLAEACDERLA